MQQQSAYSVNRRQPSSTPTESRSIEVTKSNGNPFPARRMLRPNAWPCPQSLSQNGVTSRNLFRHSPLSFTEETKVKAGGPITNNAPMPGGARFSETRLRRIDGKTIPQRAPDRPVWLSTAGSRASWLHVQLDSRLNHYGFGPRKEPKHP